MRCPRLACIWMCFALYAVVAFFLSIRFLCYIHSHRVSVIKLSACIMVLCAACSRVRATAGNVSAVRYRARAAHLVIKVASKMQTTK